MSNEKTACVRMEEGYMRVTVNYTGSSSRSEICDTIGEIEKELDVAPEVIHRRDGEDSGFFSVEFSGEDYICSRTCGEFVELLIKRLNIDMCNTNA
ncbi:MAG: hypothetical protein U9R27_00670 [Campylobacterota bacterium]|nr:hypothetical protein [Campylobacterota bacterium]